MAENVPLAQLGDVQLPICTDNRCPEDENEDQSVSGKFCTTRALNFVRAKSQLFYLLFAFKLTCFLLELGIYTKHYINIMNTRNPEAIQSHIMFDQMKVLHLSQHLSQMQELILKNLIILAIIFFDAAPFYWTLIGRIVKWIFHGCRRVLWCVRREHWSDSNETQVGEIKHSMAASFPVALLLLTIGEEISLEVYSIVVNVFFAIAISGFIGICVRILKPPQYFKFMFLWMLSVAITYIMTDVVSPLLEHRKHFPKDALETQITNLSQSVGFPPNNIYISKFGKDYGVANDGVAYQAGIFLHHRIVFMDKPILYSYDELEDDKVTSLEFDNSEETTADKNATSPDVNLQRIMKLFRSFKSNKDIVKGILAHELGHWACHHTLLDFIGVGLYRLLMVLVFAILCKHKHFYAAFGFNNTQPILVGALIIFVIVAAPFNLFTTFVGNLIHQMMEYQADRYAVSLGMGSEICSFLVKFSRGAPFQDDWLFTLYNSTHPSGNDRIKALNCTAT